MRVSSVFDEADRLGGSAVLGDLARRASGCIGTAPTAETKAVAYVLCKVLSAIADDRDERPLDWDETQRFTKAARQPIADAIECLCYPRRSKSWERVIEALIQIEIDFTPSPA
jgi:hypothetical protein